MLIKSLSAGQPSQGTDLEASQINHLFFSPLPIPHSALHLSWRCRWGSGCCNPSVTLPSPLGKLEQHNLQELLAPSSTAEWEGKKMCGGLGFSALMQGFRLHPASRCSETVQVLIPGKVSWLSLECPVLPSKPGNQVPHFCALFPLCNDRMCMSPPCAQLGCRMALPGCDFTAPPHLGALLVVVVVTPGLCLSSCHPRAGTASVCWQ